MLLRIGSRSERYFPTGEPRTAIFEGVSGMRARNGRDFSRAALEFAINMQRSLGGTAGLGPGWEEGTPAFQSVPDKRRHGRGRGHLQSAIRGRNVNGLRDLFIFSKTYLKRKNHHIS